MCASPAGATPELSSCADATRAHARQSERISARIELRQDTTNVGRLLGGMVDPSLPMHTMPAKPGGRRTTQMETQEDGEAIGAMASAQLSTQQSQAHAMHPLQRFRDTAYVDEGADEAQTEVNESDVTKASRLGAVAVGRKAGAGMQNVDDDLDEQQVGSSVAEAMAEEEDQEVEEGDVDDEDDADEDDEDDDDLTPMITEFKKVNLGFTQVPQEVLTYQYLHFLDVSANNLSSLPAGLCNLKLLVQISASKNKLTSLPDDLHMLPNLINLDVSSNLLTTLPPSIGDCPSLEALYLGGNRISRFPMPILNLPKLKRLYLGSNLLQRIPRGISKLQHLEVLYLGGNKLQALSEDLCCLPLLTLLYIGDNQLTQLPTNLAQLVSLKTLNIHNNRLRTLPLQVTAMPALQQLGLRGNPLLTAPIYPTTSNPLSLQESCARFVVRHKIPYVPATYPRELCRFLDSARPCTNPECDGVYFRQTVDVVELMSVCRKERVPVVKPMCSLCFYKGDIPHTPSAASKSRKVRRKARLDDAAA
eukprot:m.358908 g.358908  ORF g.358908 m.358908 type:complete len:533 (-) comp18333_c0_seq1:357-1955(-)